MLEQDFNTIEATVLEKCEAALNTKDLSNSLKVRLIKKFIMAHETDLNTLFGRLLTRED